MTKQMTFHQRVVDTFYQLKNNLPTKVSPVLPIRDREGAVVGRLRVISKESSKKSIEIKHLSDWRRTYSYWFPSMFRVTISGTKRWVTERLLKVPDRILFMVEDLEGNAIGHVGLNRFDFKHESCEIDNVIRGNATLPGIMTLALKELTNWTIEYLGVKKLYLKCFSDNVRAISLYKRCGFKKDVLIPVKKVRRGHMTVWEEIPGGRHAHAERYNLQMRYP